MRFALHRVGTTRSSTLPLLTCIGLRLVMAGSDFAKARADGTSCSFARMKSL
jgi:hypothetical protein